MKHCIICGEELPENPLFVLEQAPASAQDIPDAEQVKTDAGVTLRLCQCRSCGLVQFDCGPVDYYRDVIRSGGYSSTMVNLRSRQYRHLIEHYHLEGKKFLEAGCGRGEFLKVLAGFPVQAYGVEHQQSLVDIAVEDGLDVVRGFTETEDTVLGHNMPYDAFLSFNFLEHQPKPGVMLDCIWNNLAEGGYGLITVPSLEYILQHDGYYELIRDHIAYYTFDTLRGLLERHGFRVLEEEMINRDTISMIVQKHEKSERSGETAGYSSGMKPEGALAAADGPAPVDVSGLTDSLTRLREQLDQLTGELIRNGRRLAVWGASHQGFTLAATTCLGKRAEYIIDSAPFKQGRFAPASHLPIVPPDYFPEHRTDTILIVAPGYTEEIAGVIRSRFGAEVDILALRSKRVEKLG